MLKSHGGDEGKVLPADASDARLVTRLGTELVVAAQAALTQEEEELKAKLSQLDEASRVEETTKGDGKARPELEKELERVSAQLRSLRHNWRFVVIDDNTINTFVTDTLPGYVFIHRGLINLMRKSHDQLSFIIGHEVSHHILEHNEHQRQTGALLSLLQILVRVVARLPGAQHTDKGLIGEGILRRRARSIVPKEFHHRLPEGYGALRLAEQQRQ